MKNTIASIIAFTLAAGCGDFADEQFQEPELGTAQQALTNIPAWYGFGQWPGGGNINARHECLATDPNQACYIPVKKKVYYTYPDQSDVNGPPALGGFSAAWWKARYEQGLTWAMTRSGSHGFTFVACGATASHTCPLAVPGGNMWLKIRSREASGPNSALDGYGWVVPSAWTQVPGTKYRKMTQCDAQGKPNGIITDPLFNDLNAGAVGTDPLGFREQFAENVIARQIMQCLGLGTFPSQGGFQTLPEPWGLMNEAAVTDAQTDFVKSYRRPDYWQRGQDILQFEHGLLQGYVP